MMLGLSPQYQIEIQPDVTLSETHGFGGEARGLITIYLQTKTVISSRCLVTGRGEVRDNPQHSYKTSVSLWTTPKPILMNHQY